MKKKLLISQLFGLILLAASFLFPLPAQAQTGPQAWSGECVYEHRGNQIATIQGIECMLGNLLSIAIPMLGFLAFVMLIFGGWRYLLSGGNTKATEQARSTITFAIVGIILALSAFIIVNIIAQFTGVDQILEISIPSPSSSPSDQVP